MKNVFLIGNGFDLHHMLPTKYFNFMCVAEYLKSSILNSPLNVGKIFSECEKSESIKRFYNAHKEVLDSTEIEVEKASEITKLL